MARYLCPGLHDRRIFAELRNGAGGGMRMRMRMDGTSREPNAPGEGNKERQIPWEKCISDGLDNL